VGDDNVPRPERAGTRGTKPSPIDGFVPLELAERPRGTNASLRLHSGEPFVACAILASAHSRFWPVIEQFVARACSGRRR